MYESRMNCARVSCERERVRVCELDCSCLLCVCMCLRERETRREALKTKNKEPASKMDEESRGAALPALSLSSRSLALYFHTRARTLPWRGRAIMWCVVCEGKGRKHSPAGRLHHAHQRPPWARVQAHSWVTILLCSCPRPAPSHSQNRLCLLRPTNARAR